MSLWAVLDEAVLRRQVGDAAVMRAQLDHLREAAGWPNVTVQVLPYSVGAHAAFGFSFMILGFPGTNGGEVVHVEQLNSGLYLEKEADLRRYTLVTSCLRAVALNPERSAEMIARAAEDMS